MTFHVSSSIFHHTSAGTKGASTFVLSFSLARSLGAFFFSLVFSYHAPCHTEAFAILYGRISSLICSLRSVSSANTKVKGAETYETKYNQWPCSPSKYIQFRAKRICDKK
jgi:hypothetical protein